MGSRVGVALKKEEEVEERPFECHPRLTEEESEGIVTTEGYRRSTFDKRKLFYSVTYDRTLSPTHYTLQQGETKAHDKTAPSSLRYRGLIFFVHGILEHGARYRHLFSLLAQEGFVVFAQDHISHGRSDNVTLSTSSDAKTFCPSGHISIYQAVDDCVAFVQEAYKNLLPEEVRFLPTNENGDFAKKTSCSLRNHPPIFLIGQSFGGAVSILASLRLQRTKLPLRGLVLTSSAMKSKLSLLLRFQALFLPLARKLIPRARMVDVASPDSMARHSEEAERYVRDPLNCGGNLDLYTAFEIMRGFDEIVRRKSEMMVPILALHGTEDVVCDPSAVKMFVETCGSGTRRKGRTNKFVSLDAFWHTCFHDREWRTPARMIVAWVLEDSGSNERGA